VKNNVPHLTRHSLISLCSVFALAENTNSQISFPSTDSGASYSSVTALEYRAADQLLHYSEEPFQFVRLWLPSSADKKEKLIVFIHGGGCLNEFDMEHTYPLANALAQKGYPVWSLEYRRTGDSNGEWPASYNVVKAGIQWLSNLSSFTADTEDAVIVGRYAGGHLALLAGRNFFKVNSIAGLVAITGIVKYAGNTNDGETATALFMRSIFAQAKELYQTANPANLNLNKKTVLLHDTADSIVNISQSNLQNADLLDIQEADHLDWLQPGTDVFLLPQNSLEKPF
jgi:acetyl esterase/lipase